MGKFYFLGGVQKNEGSACAWWIMDLRMDMWLRTFSASSRRNDQLVDPFQTQSKTWSLSTILLDSALGQFDLAAFICLSSGVSDELLRGSCTDLGVPLLEQVVEQKMGECRQKTNKSRGFVSWNNRSEQAHHSVNGNQLGGPTRRTSAQPVLL